MPESKRARRKEGGKNGPEEPRPSSALHWLGAVAVLAAVATWGYLALEGAGNAALEALEGARRPVPVEVFAAPTVLRVGEPLVVADVVAGLDRLGYRRVGVRPERPGEFRASNDELEIFRRAHQGRLGPATAIYVRAVVRRGEVVVLEDGAGRRLDVVTAEPERLGAFHGSSQLERRPLPLARFPRRLVQAVIAAEDGRFLKHPGVDARALLRAAKADVFGKGPLQGGSTITQQVIKNRVVGHDRTVRRKLREAALALWVERKLSKDRILEIYLNEIYLGQRGSVSVIGFPAAARHYFGKNLADLDLSESAMLAGLIASPGRYDPRRNEERARARRDWVLGRMVEVGYLDPGERDLASKRAIEPVRFDAPRDESGDLLDAVRREAARRGWEPRPGTAPVRIFTSIDPGLQRASVAALRATLERLEEESPARRPLEGAVVAIRPGSGEIAAIVGGRSGARGGFHRALDARRQPGSAFKPFVALAAFAERGYAPSHILADEPVSVTTSRGTWTPRNIDGEYRGEVTLRRALEQSLNVPFARLGIDVGPAAVARWARASGVTSSLPRYPSVALGTGEISPLELANAYATVASLGVLREPHLVRGALYGEEGEAEVALARPVPPRRTLDRGDAYLVLDAMAGVTLRGTARRMSSVLGGRRVAAKTGTTQNGRDAWFVMASGNLVLVVWVGRDDAGAVSLSGSRAALPVAQSVVASTGGRFLAPLPWMPAEVRRLAIDPSTGGEAAARCPTRVVEVFREDRVPGPCREHSGFWRRMWDRLGGRQESDRPTGRAGEP